MNYFRSSFWTVFVGVLLATITIAHQPALAQIFLPQDSSTHTADDVAVFRSIHETVKSTKAEQLEVALTKLESKPGLTAKQRLMVLSYKAANMIVGSRSSQAVDLIRTETLAHPDDPLAQIILAQTAFEASDYPTVANAVIAATRLQSGLVDQISPYELRVLFDRLDAAEQYDLSNALGRRLFDAGWTTGLVGLRSSVAKELVLDLLKKDDHIASRRYVVEVQSPSTLAAMLADNRYAPVHLTIADWAGARLEKQWPIYLAESRRAFDKERSATAANGYAAALSSADHDRTLIATFAPLAELQFTETRDEEWLFTITYVTSAMARRGQWDAAFATLDRVSKLLDPESSNRINLSSNRARLRLLKGDFEVASRLFVSVVQEAKTNEAVGPPTMARFEAYRLCAAHQHGSAQAEVEAGSLSKSWSSREPGSMAWLWLCLGNPKAARDAWLSAIDDPEKRSLLLAFLQPDSETAFASKFARDMDERLAIFRRDPTLRTAAQKAGSIRSWKLTAAAPKD